VELEPPAPRLCLELRERLGLEVGLGQAERALAAEIRFYRGHLEQGRDAASLAALRLSCADVLAGELEDALGRPVPGGQDMVDVLMASLRFRVFDDVPGVLDELAGLGLRLVVVSNWDISLSDVLGRLGVSRRLAGVVTSAEVGARKPDPAAFRRGLALAGASAGHAVHVGDSPYEDVEGARAAGIEAVLISRGGPSPPAAGVRAAGPQVEGRRVRGPRVADPRFEGPRVETIRTLAELPPLVSALDG
jgi:putative hydrolase of the HAD superfamily